MFDRLEVLCVLFSMFFFRSRRMFCVLFCFILFSVFVPPLVYRNQCIATVDMVHYAYTIDKKISCTLQTVKPSH